MIRDHYLNDLIFSLNNKKDCKTVEFTQMAVKEFVGYLQELKERRESELRPATKYLGNNVEEQIEHIAEELKEVVDSLSVVFDEGKQEELIHSAEELVDLQTSCETMLAILGLDEQQRREARKKVIDKNKIRGYYEVNEK